MLRKDCRETYLLRQKRHARAGRLVDAKRGADITHATGAGLGETAACRVAARVLGREGGHGVVAARAWAPCGAFINVCLKMRRWDGIRWGVERGVVKLYAPSVWVLSTLDE